MVDDDKLVIVRWRLIASHILLSGLLQNKTFHRQDVCVCAQVFVYVCLFETIIL